MLLLEPVYGEGRFDMPAHLRQFATVQIMDRYGKVLLDFKSNPEFVNDCVLTLMHHGKIRFLTSHKDSFPFIISLSSGWRLEVT